MKITLLFSPLHPTGGISSWTYNMLEYIQEHHIQNVYHVDASIHFKSAKSCSRFRRLWSGIWDTLILMCRFGNALVKYKPDCVHITTSASWALNKDRVYLWIASFFKVNVVFHYHFGRIPELAKTQNWEWNKLITCLQKAKQAIVIDPYSYQVLLDNGFGDKVSYVPNPCSPFVEAIAKRPVKKKERNKFIFVGHVYPAKGVYELVEVFIRLKEKVDLEIIGLCSDKMCEELKEKAASKSEGKWLNIVGNKDRDYVLRKMETAEALILPSYTEGFPNVVLEAMACGCPVIATNVGAIEEMLSVRSTSDSCGICVFPKDVDGLVSALEQLMNNDLLKKAFAQNGKRRILNHYTMEQVFPLYQKVWNIE